MRSDIRKVTLRRWTIGTGQTGLMTGCPCGVGKAHAATLALPVLALGGTPTTPCQALRTAAAIITTTPRRLAGQLRTETGEWNTPSGWRDIAEYPDDFGPARSAGVGATAIDTEIAGHDDHPLYDDRRPSCRRRRPDTRPATTGCASVRSPAPARAARSRADPRRTTSTTLARDRPNDCRRSRPHRDRRPRGSAASRGAACRPVERRVRHQSAIRSVDPNQPVDRRRRPTPTARPTSDTRPPSAPPYLRSPTIGGARPGERLPSRGRTRETSATSRRRRTAEPGGGRRRRADDTGEYGGRRRAPDSTDTGQWERMTDTGQYVRTTTTGDWDRLTDTGSHSTPAPRRDWDRMTDTGAHERAIAWDRLTDTGSHSIADDRAEERFEAFWSGHRLAGDDPRWVATPSSAPRSPAISYPERRRVDEPVPRPRAPRPAGRAAAPPVRRPVAAPPRRRPEPLQDLDTEQTNVLTVLFYTAIWYAVPVLVFGAWLITLDNSAPAGCVSDITGGGCESARAHAFESLLGGVRLFGIALGASLVLAIFMRWLGRGWRAGSIALAAAVVGGGLSTVVLSALNGQPIG